MAAFDWSALSSGGSQPPLVLIRGAGDLASGVAYRLVQAGFPVVMTELPKPMAVRITVSFCACVAYQTVCIEGVVGRRIELADSRGLREALDTGVVPVVVDPDGSAIPHLEPAVVIDARVAKVNLVTHIDDAPIVIGLGPGFTAGVDCHAVVETNRGHNLGRVYWQGSAEPDTGKPAAINGKDFERVLRAPHAGVVYADTVIGMLLKQGQPIARVNDTPVLAPFEGVLRGLIDDETPVEAGTKIGDIDPRARRVNCFTISDKSLSIGGGTLEAVMVALRRQRVSMANQQ